MIDQPAAIVAITKKLDMNVPIVKEFMRTYTTFKNEGDSDEDAMERAIGHVYMMGLKDGSPRDL
jgi:hypothetical protein